MKGWTEEALHHALKALPIDACSALGAALGVRLGQRGYPAQNARTRALLAALRPDWAQDAATLDAALARAWANAGRVYTEFSCMGRMLRAGRHAWDGEGSRDWVFDDPDRPVIALFAHTGNWEMSGIAIAHRYPGRAATIFDPPRDDRRAEIARRVRAEAPWTLLPMGRMVWRDAMAHLARGGILCTAVDEMDRGRISAPTFGRPVRPDGNLGKIVRIALRTRARVLPVVSERLSGTHLVTHVLDPLDLTGTDPRDEEAVEDRIRQIQTLVEPRILALADQWHMAIEVGAAHFVEGLAPFPAPV